MYEITNKMGASEATHAHATFFTTDVTHGLFKTRVYQFGDKQGLTLDEEHTLEGVALQEFGIFGIFHHEGVLAGVHDHQLAIGLPGDAQAITSIE